jgi:hypothetical protein
MFSNILLNCKSEEHRYRKTEDKMKNKSFRNETGQRTYSWSKRKWRELFWAICSLDLNIVLPIQHISHQGINEVNAISQTYWKNVQNHIDNKNEIMYTYVLLPSPIVTQKLWFRYLPFWRAPPVPTRNMTFQKTAEIFIHIRVASSNFRHGWL